MSNTSTDSGNGGSDIGAAVAALYALTLQLRRECPWDRVQTAGTIVPHTLEETYELIDAVRHAEGSLERDGESSSAFRTTLDEVVDELGDLLFQVCFLSMWCEEHGVDGGLSVVARGIHAKLVRRHPHVFGDERAESADEVRGTWESVKRNAEQRTLFGGIPRSMPALGRAVKVQQRASGIGFDFDAAEAALAKVDEEVAELREALATARAGADMPPGEERPPDEQVMHEVGDVLFAASNVARLCRVPAELALGQTTDRFQQRVTTAGELALQHGETFADLDIERQEHWYQQARRQLRRASSRTGH